MAAAGDGQLRSRRVVCRGQWSKVPRIKIYEDKDDKGSGRGGGGGAEISIDKRRLLNR